MGERFGFKSSVLHSSDRNYSFLPVVIFALRGAVFLVPAVFVDVVLLFRPVAVFLSADSVATCSATVAGCVSDTSSGAGFKDASLEPAGKSVSDSAPATSYSASSVHPGTVDFLVFFAAFTGFVRALADFTSLSFGISEPVGGVSVSVFRLSEFSVSDAAFPDSKSVFSGSSDSNFLGSGSDLTSDAGFPETVAGISRGKISPG